MTPYRINIFTGEFDYYSIATAPPAVDYDYDFMDGTNFAFMNADDYEFMN